MSRHQSPLLFLLGLSVVSASVGGGLSACVIGRDTRPSANESAQGPLGMVVTGSPVVPTTRPTNPQPEAAPAQHKSGQLWVSGYWHWDGVRDVWQRGRWEDAPTTSK